MSFGNIFVVLSSVGDIELDASLNEDHRFQALITRNPVEDGSVYSDNVVTLPFELNMTARVSDASMVPLIPSENGKAIDAYEALVELQSNKELIEVVTGIRTYANMFVEEIRVPRESADGNSLRFELKLSELLIVGGETVSNRDRVEAGIRHTALPVSAGGTVQGVPI